MKKYIPTSNNDLYLSEIAKAWGNDSHMMKYFKKNLSDCYVLSNGMPIFYEKQEIEKNFCFGYHDGYHDTESYDTANKLADHARTSEKYFIKENMAFFDNEIKRIKDQEKALFFRRISYCNCDEDLNLFDVVGGYYCDKETNEAHFHCKLVEVPDELRPEILACLNIQREKHLKKVNAYLKRYGLSNVRSWAFWADE